MERGHASDFAQELLDLYDDYFHGRIARRGFLQGAAKFAVGGLTAEALLASLNPNYAWVQQVAKDDPRLKTEYVKYSSPKGVGTMRGYLAWPAAAHGKLPAVLVIHENRGLNLYIEDVTRRLGVAGFLAFAPDALTPLGGYPGNRPNWSTWVKEPSRGCPVATPYRPRSIYPGRSDTGARGFWRGYKPGAPASIGGPADKQG